MSRFTRLFVIGAIAVMALVTLAVTAWRWEAYTQGGVFSDRKLMLNTFALVFLPLWLGLGAFATGWMLSRSNAALPLAPDTRRVGENSLVAAALLTAGVHLWTAAGAVLGEPPGREFGGRLVVAIAGVFFILNANFVAKTSPPPAWPDPGRWIRATLRTGWVGVAAGLVILATAIMAPLGSMGWIVIGATVVYGLASVLNHLGGRKTA
jgi:hypothetical protein